MSKEYKNFIKGIAITPKDTTGNQKAGELEVRSDNNNKLYYYNGNLVNPNDPIVQEYLQATLSNKTLTAPVINNQTADTITGIAGGDLSLQSATGEKVIVEAISFDNSTISASTDLNINADAAANVYLQKSTTNIARVDSDGIAYLNEDKAKFYDADNSNFVGIKSPATVPADYTIVLPANAPDPNTALVYDGTDYKWSTAGGGDASGSNDDILATAFRARILDTFEDQNTASSSSINPTATTASWSSLNQYYTIQYENTTITNGNTTTPTLAVTPAFLAVGDVIIFNNEVRKITVLSPLTINAAFTTASGSCTVSQVVSSKELYGSAFDGASISDAFNNSEFSEFLIDYQDSTTSIYTPNIVPVIGYSVSQDNTSWLDAGVRPTLQTDQIQSGTFANPGTALYVMLFSNVSVGSGSVNLLEYRAYMQKSPIVTTGTLNQAYARFDGSITPQHCALSTVSGKTRVTLDWTYSNGVNNPDTYGAIDVYINGQFIPRQVGSYLTTGAFYKEISNTVIELDTDYATTPYAIQIVQRQSPSNFVAPAGLSGSTGGSGLKNYITTYKNNPGNGDFETGDASGWEFVSGVTIDATTKVPSGGSFVSTVAGITNTVISVNQLAADYSLSSAMTTGASIQGKGIASKVFTIDIEDQAKVLGFKFAYKLASDANAGTANAFNASGTSANTLAVYIYDVTAGAWIQPAGVYNIVQTSGVGYASGTFQTSSTGTQYRIVILNINTYTTNCTVVFDDFFVGPQISVNAPAVSDWQSYTPTLKGTVSDPNIGTTGTISGKWKRVGDSAQFHVIVNPNGTGITNGSGSYYFTLPSGLVVDTGKLVTGSVSVQSPTGVGSVFNVGVSSYSATSAYNGTGIGVTIDAGTFVGQNTPAANWLSAGDLIEAFIELPIAGWSSNSVASNDTDTRVVAASYHTLSSTTITNGTPLKYTTLLNDTHSAYNTITGAYIIPVSGVYEISLNGTFSASASDLRLFKNGVNILGSGIFMAINTARASGTIQITCNAGDSLTVVPNTTVTAADTNGVISIKRLSGPSVIAATETVAMHYSNISGTLTTSTDSLVSFTTKDFDTHNSYSTSTGLFTAPVSGIYQVNAQICSTSPTAVRSNGVIIYKGSTAVYSRYYGLNTVSGGTNLDNSISGLIKCNAGETISIKVWDNGTSPTVFADNTRNHLSIVRVGN